MQVSWPAGGRSTVCEEPRSEDAQGSSTTSHSVRLEPKVPRKWERGEASGHLVCPAQ